MRRMKTQQSAFGQWLRANRVDRRFTVEGLARKAGISKQYLSVLERAPKHPLTGKAVQPSVEIVDRIAKALNIPIDEARIAAGYAPLNPATKPETVAELLEAIERLGVDHIMFAEDLNEMTPEDLSDILDSITQLHRASTAPQET
jgi:transcriptional regulator with XRE-family HTH domain